MSKVDLAYTILKEVKGWNLIPLDEQGAMCVTAANDIAEDAAFETLLRKMVVWYNENA